MSMEGWKDRAAERFLKSIEESRKVGFDRVLYALGIRYVGEATARSVARHFGNIDAIASAGIEELLTVEDVGQVIAESIHEFFASEDNKVVVERLRAAGLKFEMEAESKALSSALEGMTIVISGNFSISRDEMKALIVAHGGKNSGSVSGRTSYLLAGEKAGPEKLKKAEALGVKIIDESGFRKLTGEQI
jgi:DNA ligase (NAD+)